MNRTLFTKAETSLNLESSQSNTLYIGQMGASFMSIHRMYRREDAQQRVEIAASLFTAGSKSEQTRWANTQHFIN